VTLSVLANALAQFNSGVSIAILDSPNTPSTCTAATNFLARTTLIGQDARNFTTLICGLVTDGVITRNLSGAKGCGSVLDSLYILAAPNTTTANLNLCGTSFTLTPTGSPSLTVYQGYTGVDASSYVFIDTGLNPSTNGGNYTQNAARISAWSNSNRTPGVNVGGLIGNAANFGNPVASYITPKLNNGNLQAQINDNASAATQSGFTNTAGWFVVNRTGASAVYQNAVSFDSEHHFRHDAKQHDVYSSFQ
jgi:hypothetical protein